MSEAKRQVFYCDPPTKCDVCKGIIGLVFYDAATVMGPWGNLCPNCFSKYGYGVGAGRGQEYRLQPSGKYLKTRG